MKKLFLTIFLPALLLALLLSVETFGQSKPRNPVAPSGSWATNLVRAYAFSRADSVAIDSVRDWGPGSFWGISDATAAKWTNESAESPGYNVAGTASRAVACGNLSASGITNSFTLVQRVKLTVNGTVNWSVSLHNRLASPTLIFGFNNFGYNQAGQCRVVTTGTVNSTTGTLGAQNSFATVIMTYAGDSVRVWVNGTRTDADAQTGNINVSSTYNFMIGEGDGGVFDNHYSGTVMMTCLWGRVLSQSEIDAVFDDPYIMFRASSSTQHSRVIMIMSILTPIQAVVVILLIIIATPIVLPIILLLEKFGIIEKER